MPLITEEFCLEKLKFVVVFDSSCCLNKLLHESRGVLKMFVKEKLEYPSIRVVLSS